MIDPQPYPTDIPAPQPPPQDPHPYGPDPGPSSPEPNPDMPDPRPTDPPEPGIKFGGTR
ncbi:MAG: hypothetical protein NVS2B16_08210 [Chloroflexota bacterium]